MQRLLAALTAWILFASAFPVGALALSSRDPLLHADLSRAEFKFDYTPFANSEYALYIFSEDGGEVHAEAELIENGKIIASGEGFGEILSAWLAADTRYTIRVRGSGRAVIEVARNALSRCRDQALEAAEDASQGKIIARDYDAHWYSFMAQDSTLLMLTCIPEEGALMLSAALFDDTGMLISYFDELSGGACMLLAATEQGRKYSVRVCAPGGGTGYYSLNLTRSDGPEIARPLRFDAPKYNLAVGGVLDLSASVSGEPLIWVSDNPDVAVAMQDGSILGMGAGETRITAHGMTSSHSCTVAVEYVLLEGLRIAQEEIIIPEGETVMVTPQLIPENSSERHLRYIVHDSSIAAADGSGAVEGLRIGESILTVRSPDGLVSDSVLLRVVPAQTRYRALLIGEQNYPFSENSVRTGSENSIQAIESLLSTLSFEGRRFETRTAADLSRGELIAEIRSAFLGAREQDVSLLYITCHGSFTGGMSFLELSDGSMFSVRDLERELRNIPGTIVVLIDCCGSGGAIGAASDSAAFAKGITGAFSGASIRGSKYKVLCSAGLDQDSFRIAFNENAASGVMATVFARALCDGGGWSIDRSARKAMSADSNYDRKISLDELAQYMSGRVNWYLGIASELTGSAFQQDIQVYPEGDPFILFDRSEE